MGCSITVLDVPLGRVVAIAGDADVSSADDLNAAIEEATGNGPIVIDLSEATLVDSRTIGVLAGWHKTLRLTDGGLRLVATDPDLLRLFATIGLEREFEFFPSREAAFGE